MAVKRVLRAVKKAVLRSKKSCKKSFNGARAVLRAVLRSKKSCKKSLNGAKVEQLKKKRK